MQKTNRISVVRFIYVLVILMMFIFSNIFIAFYNHILFDAGICLGSINICFFLIFIVLLIKERLNNRLPERLYISYGKITFTLAVCFIITITSMLWAPVFFAPVMVIPLILNNVVSDKINICLSIYLVVVVFICQGRSAYNLVTSIMLIIFGLMLSDYCNNKNILETIFAMIIILSVNILIPLVFYYFTYTELSMDAFIYSLICGVFTCGFVSVYNPLITKQIIEKNDHVYDEILDDNYDLVKDIRRYSYIEYQHAKRVSKFAALCACEINANEKLAACGGFYYRLGKMEGEPEIDNAIKVANHHCFPVPIIDIISEYYGVLSLPSSRESAIVHMVDTIVTKIELLDSGTVNTYWNKNMVIYQTINENSQNGMYDQSGLSMNDFLKVRERLANEDILS